MPKTPLHSHKPGKEPKFKRCPPFEEAAAAYIENEADKNRALDFAQWLRMNKLSPSTGNNGYNWYINFKYVDYNKYKDGNYYCGTYHGCYIKLFDDTWHIFPSKDILEQILLQEELKEVLWNSLFPCYGCNYGCFKYTHNTEYETVILGRVFTGKGICRHNPICLSNPDNKTLEVVKRVLLARKNSTNLEIKTDMNIYNYGMI